ncbi:hypothetical protein [Desulfuromonas sp. AOP6]|uniref:hypothetical protein n=1 Tax=Desulfuromonas sp. AOP6 TaxID=1566351 RepID=UPI00127A299D|nr:hypothetical protein [Desulfuromonas sp. AOP6]BCA78444.1 hypothetical protein AOP6_0231 [Desulfuromonas sp. AOP6]
MLSGPRAARRPNPPEPNRHPGRGALLFSILSIIVSLLFIFYGVTLVRLNLFGITTVAYGVLNLLVLACAYHLRVRWCVTAIQTFAGAYLLFYVLALSTGMETGLGVSGILVVSLALWCNWFAITKVIRQPG